jgi:hypothetical protein
VGVKRPGREADHSPPSSAEVLSYTSIPHYAFMAWCLGKKHGDNFTFFLYKFLNPAIKLLALYTAAVSFTSK